MFVFFGNQSILFAACRGSFGSVEAAKDADGSAPSKGGKAGIPENRLVDLFEVRDAMIMELYS